MNAIPATPTLFARVQKQAVDFIRAPASLRPLAWFRIGVAAVLLVQAFALVGGLLELFGYAFLVWPRRTRRLTALATLGLHAGIAVTMGLWSFSALMMVLTGSAFLVPDG
jgi:hypothetical protein